MTWPTKTDFVDGDVLNASQMNNIGTNLNEIDPTGITDGYVLTADGAGGIAWEALAASAPFTLLTSTTSTATTTTLSATFSNYRKIIVAFVMSTSNNERPYLTFNNDTNNNNYNWYGQYQTSGAGQGNWGNFTYSSYMIAGYTSYTGSKLATYEFIQNPSSSGRWQGNMVSLLTTSAGTYAEGNIGGGSFHLGSVTTIEVVCASRSTSNVYLYGMVA